MKENEWHSRKIKSIENTAGARVSAMLLISRSKIEQMQVWNSKAKETKRQGGEDGIGKNGLCLVSRAGAMRFLKIPKYTETRARGSREGGHGVVSALCPHRGR